tara:strand:+ start:254 stop:799 length:546 start_codon:yes stop_codon:yes gene_type:complete
MKEVKAVLIIQRVYREHLKRCNEILEWTKHNLFKDKKIGNKLEKIWGNKMTGGKKTNQWTTKLGEYIVKRTLELKGNKVRRPKCINGYKPDWETDEYIYEVKTRNWTTSGTAGEKVYGVPFKYSDIPRLYGKPLKIVCVAYQEEEMNNKIFSNKISIEKKMMKKIWSEMDITFEKFSQLRI